MKAHYAINLKIVRLADAADAVKPFRPKPQPDVKRAARWICLWVNGENFRTLKEANLLQTGWAETLPNWRYVDTQLPVRVGRFFLCRHKVRNHSGAAQLTFIARRDVTPQPPQTPQALLELLKPIPARLPIRAPTGLYRHGVSEQLLIMLTPDPPH